MKKYLLISFVVTVFRAMLPAQQTAAWEEAPGPFGGSVGFLQTLGNRQYATHYKGNVYRSVDYGAHWEKLNVPKIDPDSYTEELHIGFSGDFYKIVTYPSGLLKLYRSTDEGMNWAVQNDDLQIVNFREAPSGTLIGVGKLGALYRSANKGVTWQFLLNPSGFAISKYSFALSFTSNNKTMLSGGPSSGGFAISSDDGLIWTEGQAPGAFTNPKLVSSGTVFGIPDYGMSGLYRSANQGASWDTIPFPFAAGESFSSIFELNSGRLLLSTTLHTYFSDNDGVDWQLMPTQPGPPYEFILDFALPNGDIMGLRDGLYRSSDGGATWAFSSEGIRQADTRQLAFVTDSLQLALTNGGLWRTDDGGGNWTRLFHDTSTVFLYARHPLALLNKDSFMIKTGKRALLSADGGQTFSDVSPGGGLFRGDLFASGNKNLYCTGTAGTLRSTDLGNTWTTILPNTAINALEEHPSGHLFAFTKDFDQSYQETLRRSTDGGATWAVVNTLVIPASQRRALQVGSNGKIYVTGFYDNTMKLAISSDEGATWVYKIIPDIYSYDDFIAVNDIGRIFTTGTPDIKILTSADEGDSWYYLPDYSDNTSPLNGLEVSPAGFLYIVPSSGTLYRSISTTESGAYITGHVRKDADMVCSTPDAQEPLENWVVELHGAEEYYATTGTDGHYTFFVDTGQYVVRARTPQYLWWSICDSLQSVQADSLFQIDTADFAVIALSECPLMTADIAIPALNRCFDNTVYVHYCNQGSEPAENSWVEVTLDPYLSFVNTAQPYFSVGNNVYHFLTGDVAPGECNTFSFTVHVDCDSTVPGQTHCVLAHAYPDTLCTTVQNWSGATIQAEVNCQDTTVQMRLYNSGSGPSQVLQYIIIEDDVVLFQGQKQYGIDDDLTLHYPANGHTWRIESQQEPGHPFSNTAVAFNEGCGGFETLGFINQFDVNTFQPSWNQVCVQNTGSFDPNDKQGFPLGYGDEHLIRPGQALEYMIRFQNTGTGPAFNIVIRDTLSGWLDPATVRPGASSHAYAWSLDGQGVLRFSFNNIQLPDSNTNLAASQGFVKFRVDQKPDLPPGAKIYNRADVYFDYNLPVATNTTLHTVGIDYITGTSAPPLSKWPRCVSVWPNPLAESALFQLKNGVFQGHRLTVTDAFGRTVQTAELTGKHYRFSRKGLPPGAYFFRVEDAAGRLVDSGTLLLL